MTAVFLKRTQDQRTLGTFKKLYFLCLRNKMINLVPVITITSSFDCKLVSMKNAFYLVLTEILHTDGTCCYMTSAE